MSDDTKPAGEPGRELSVTEASAALAAVVAKINTRASLQMTAEQRACRHVFRDSRVCVVCGVPHAVLLEDLAERNKLLAEAFEEANKSALAFADALETARDLVGDHVCACGCLSSEHRLVEDAEWPRDVDQFGGCFTCECSQFRPVKFRIEVVPGQVAP